MPELFKTFVCISVLSMATFWVALKALPEFLPPNEYKRWVASWFTVLVAAFASQNIWIFVAITVVFCFVRIPNSPKSRVIYYLVLFCTVSAWAVIIPGFLGLNYLFKLDYPLLLILVILVFPFFKFNAKPKLFSLSSDRYVVLLVLLMTYLSFRDNTFTNALRESFLFFLRIFIPYYMLSRHLADNSQLNRAFIALFIGLAPFAAIGIYETITHWHVYNALSRTLIGHATSSYDFRSGGLRASTIFGSPIVLGYAMTIGFGLLLYLKPLIKNQNFVNLAMFGCSLCILATMARGTWVGFACLGFAYIWTGRDSANKIILWGLAGIASLPVISLTPIGSKFIDLLPFIGTERSDTVDYRKQLIENAWIVFKRNPFLGSTTYLDTPEMESMRQGQGIIDLVNTFVQMGLEYGIVGVLLFLTIFLSLLLRCYLIIKRIPQTEMDLVRMGRALFAILASILVMITTVSSIDYVPVFYWALIGIVAAYLQVAEKTVKQHRVVRKIG